MSHTAEQEAVIATIRAINAAWRFNELEALDDLLHENVVFNAPGFAAEIRGREACIASYREFVTNAEVKDYEEKDYVVDVWGKTAICRYTFVVSYELQGNSHEDTGIDAFIMSRESGAWRALWRQMTV